VNDRPNDRTEEPQQRLLRPRLLRRPLLALGVALVAVAAAVASVLMMIPSLAGADGVQPGERIGYGSAPAPPAPPTTIPAPAPVDVPAAGDLPEPSGLPTPAAPAPDVEADAPFVPEPPPVTVTSGRLEDLGIDDRPAPVRLRIPSLRVDAPIEPVGYAGGEMEVPATAADVGWYEFGPRPGDTGSSVLAAHVAWDGRRGVFYELVDLPSGALIEIEFADGAVRRFESVALASYDKQELPTADIFRRDGPPVVTLITCGGAFNPSLRSYEDNIVAYAVEITDDAVR